MSSPVFQAIEVDPLQGVRHQVVVERLLPIEQRSITPTRPAFDYVYEPGPEAIFDAPAKAYATLECETARYRFNTRTGALSGIEVRGGAMPPAEDNGVRYLKIPLDVL